MTAIKKIEDIESWSKARELSRKIYSVSGIGLFSKDFELRNQIRSSAGSIMDNIAEGFERDGRKEFIYFLNISKGSSGELKSQLYRAIDNNYIDRSQFEELYNAADEISRMLKGFIEYLKTSEFKGIRYK